MNVLLDGDFIGPKLERDGGMDLGVVGTGDFCFDSFILIFFKLFVRVSNCLLYVTNFCNIGR